MADATYTITNRGRRTRVRMVMPTGKLITEPEAFVGVACTTPDGSIIVEEFNADELRELASTMNDLESEAI